MNLPTGELLGLCCTKQSAICPLRRSTSPFSVFAMVSAGGRASILRDRQSKRRPKTPALGLTAASSVSGVRYARPEQSCLLSAVFNAATAAVRVRRYKLVTCPSGVQSAGARRLAQGAPSPGRLGRWVPPSRARSPVSLCHIDAASPPILRHSRRYKGETRPRVRFQSATWLRLGSPTT